MNQNFLVQLAVRMSRTVDPLGQYMVDTFGGRSSKAAGPAAFVE